MAALWDFSTSWPRCCCVLNGRALHCTADIWPAVTALGSSAAKQPVAGWPPCCPLLLPLAFPAQSSFCGFESTFVRLVLSASSVTVTRAAKLKDTASTPEEPSVPWGEGQAWGSREAAPVARSVEGREAGSPTFAREGSSEQGHRAEPPSQSQGTPRAVLGRQLHRALPE